MTRKKFLTVLSVLPFGAALLNACGADSIENSIQTAASGSTQPASGSTEVVSGGGVSSSLPKKGRAPEWNNTTWINSEPLTLPQLQGKVVLVEFWTFDCINCQNVQPSLKSWYNDYNDKGLVIVGMHDPEFDYERKLENVQQAVKDKGLKYPVAIDNDFATWNKYGVRAWPTLYLLDKQGYIRYSHIGEGAYDTTRSAIESLLKE